VPERLGSLADTAPAVAPRMMSGQFQDVRDPATRARFEQEFGFGDFGKYFGERVIEGLRMMLEKEGSRIELPDGTVLWPADMADIAERLRRRWPEPGPQSQAPLGTSPGSLAAYAPAPPQLKPVPPALAARLHAFLNRQSAAMGEGEG